MDFRRMLGKHMFTRSSMAVLTALFEAMSSLCVHWAIFNNGGLSKFDGTF